MSAKPDITVLYEDEHMLVVDKPPRMLVVQAPGRSGPTLVDRLGKQLAERVYAVHRLDEDTTGVLAVARSPEAKAALEKVFRGHHAQRVYLALVGRVPSPPAGRIESRLIEGEDGVVRATTDRRGERAVTEYRLKERRGGQALLECKLDTGRRNQIRVHLAELGCPIVGDRKYGWRARGGGLKAKRPLLHAWKLSLIHPISGVTVEVEAPPREAELQP